MNASPRSPAALEARGITKRFGPILANDDVGLVLRPGRIHAIVGENGAGKSTLLRILYGLLRPDAGEVHLGNRPARLDSPRTARRLGIGLIPQNVVRIEAFTVLENLFLGHEGFRSVRPLSWSEARREAERLAHRYGLEIPLEGSARALGMGEAQRLQILRTLLQGARILLCDEPTSVLAPPEVAQLFATLRRLRDEGVAIALVTHKVGEVLEVADEVTVLRGGHVVAHRPAGGISADELARLIVGGEPPPARERPPVPEGPVRLALEGVACEGPGGLAGLDLEVRGGRITGIAGVEGNGQRALLEILGGLRGWDRGRIRVGERVWEAPGPLPARALDIIPDDRLGLGLISRLRVAENVLLGNLDRPELAGRCWIHRSRVLEAARRVLRLFAVQPPLPELPVEALSGGNQQRLLVGREVLRGGEVLVAAQPTQGVDVGSRRAIHDRFLEARAAGHAVLLVSSDLDEVLELADEVVVLYRGRAAARGSREEMTEERVARAMVGLETAG
jgi:simple sugar transport system ATP-binding protein